MLDWRYVLPVAGPTLGRVVLIGAPAAVTTALKQDDRADEVIADWGPPGSADVAVVLRGSRLAIDDVARMLRPGGSLYWEISRARPSRLRLTPATAKSMLVRAGLQPVEAYWVTSNAAGPAMHLPLGLDGAVAWYFSTHGGSSDPLRRLAGRLLRVLSAGRGRRLAPLVPTFAVTARRPADGDCEEVRVPTALGATDLPDWATDTHVRPVMLAGGDSPWSRTVLLPFARDSVQPSGVIKIARTSPYAAYVAAEQEMLARLHSTLPATLAASVPEPLGIASVLGGASSAECYRPGRSILARTVGTGASRRTQQADLERAAAWLGALHEATVSEPVNPDRGAVDLAGLGEEFARAFGREQREEQLFGRLAAAVGASSGRRVPSVIQHRDFGPWNVLVDIDGGISVIDWEVAGRGPALVDLIYFVAHWCWLVSGARSGSARIDVLRSLVSGDPGHWSARAGRAVIAREVRAIGLAPDAVAALIAWTFAQQALDRHDRLAAIGDATAGDRASNRYVQCVETLAAIPNLVGHVGDMLDSRAGNAT
jgi:aminoglycoside phosphotransferase (APT) family kinase protein